MTLEEYVQYLEAQSVCTISYYSGEKANLNLLVTDLSMGVKDLYDGIAGYDIITGEHLSQQERTFKLWWGIGMMSFNLLMPAISGLRAQQAIGQKIYKWLDDIFLMEGVNPRILGGISQELAEQTARSGIQTLSNKGLNTISRQITEEGVEDAIQITTREGIEDTIQTATREGIEAFGQRITPEGIPTGSHPWESIYSGVKENAAILEKQVIQQEIYIPNRYDSTYGIRATEQQFTREGVETTLETVSREGIEEMQEQAMREAAEAMEKRSKTPSEIARTWQGIGKYPGIDDYADVTVEKGTVLYRGEPNGTEYFTTLDAIEQSGRDATKLFEGLQVEKNPIHGYRGEMQGYIFNEDVASAYGITNANPQFGKGGLPQYYIPDVQDLIDKGILTPVDNIKLNK